MAAHRPHSRTRTRFGSRARRAAGSFPAALCVRSNACIQVALACLLALSSLLPASFTVAQTIAPMAAAAMPLEPAVPPRPVHQGSGARAARDGAQDGEAVPIIQLTHPVGVTLDNAAPANLWVTSDAISNALLSKFPESGPRQDFAYGNIGSSEAIGQLATEPNANFIWMVTRNGDIYALDAGNPSGWMLLARLQQMPIDTSAMYDAATGRVHNGAGVIQPLISSFGDIALLHRANFFDAFVTGESMGLPFVVRLRWSLPGGTLHSAKVVAYSSQTTSFRNVRGIAVNSDGMVLTILPYVPRTITVDAAVFFHADFPEGGGISPVFLDERLGNFASPGMTADADGRFYAVAYTQTCGPVPSYNLLMLEPTFTGGVCYPLPEPANGSNINDVAVSDDGSLAFVASFSSGKVYRYSLPPSPSDTTPPASPQLTIAESGGDDPDQHVTGTTLYYNPGTGRAGSVQVGATTSDPESGIAAVAFPAVFGGDGGTDTTSPYTHIYTWSTGASASGPKTIIATNGAGLTSSSSFAVTPDSGLPAVSLTAPAAGTTVGNGVTISANASDALAGVAKVEFRYCPGTSCAFSAGTVIGVDQSAPFDVPWTAQPPDGPYTLIARATDRVGNSVDSASRTVTIRNTPLDTTPPTAPSLTLTETEPDQHVTAATLYYNPSSGNSGVFTATAATGDPESGIASVAFPTIFGNDAANDTSPPYERTYAWSAGASASGPRTVIATNGEGLTASSAFTLTPDTTAPTVSVAAPGAGAVVPGPITVEIGAADAAAGVALVEVRICPGSTCAFASGDPVGSDDTAPFAVAWTPPSAAGAYTLVARATDNVGNAQNSPGVTVRVGNRAPVNVSAGGPYTVDEGGSVPVSGSAVDPDGDALIYGWDLDANGQVETVGQSATFSAAGRDGPTLRQIGFAVCDSLGACAATVGQVTIRNVAPVISSVTNSGPVATGASVDVMIAASDPGGAGDPLSYEFDCQNDGQFEIAPQTSPTGACVFSSAGNYRIAVRVRDGDGGSATGATTVTVTDATLGVTCTASESQNAAVARAACDGRLDTVWASKPNPVKKKGKKRPKPKPETASVTFDLGVPGNDGPHELGEMRWQVSASCCDTMNVEVSTNGTTYERIAALSGRPAANTWQALPVPSQPVQRVRLVMSSRKARQVGFVREVEFCTPRCEGASSRGSDSAARSESDTGNAPSPPDPTAASIPADAATAADDIVAARQPEDVAPDHDPSAPEAAAGTPPADGEEPIAAGAAEPDTVDETATTPDDNSGRATRRDGDSNSRGKHGKQGADSGKGKSHRERESHPNHGTRSKSEEIERGANRKANRQHARQRDESSRSERPARTEMQEPTAGAAEMPESETETAPPDAADDAERG